MTPISTIIESADGARHWDAHPTFLDLAKWAAERMTDEQRRELCKWLGSVDARPIFHGTS